MRFVISVAKQYQNQDLILPDLINGGNLGLIKAAEKFDLTRECVSVRSERVRQIKEKAIRRLRHFLRSRLLKSYIGQGRSGRSLSL